ncbi:MAG: LysR family transcriptional regulator [Acidiferrobacterales bacterium]|nr:LysR family transcriptional regulator [Acidiferrobacterales bacterium]
MEPRYLPPLKSIVYFEAAARLQSFTAASNELNVTQGAVSRQIRQLEDTLGCQLFKRDRRQVVLTDDGHNYYVSIADVLNQLSDATKRLSQPASQGRVTIVTSSAVASMYLMPRIPEFRRVHPEIQIRIVARDDMKEGLRTEHDLSLYYSRDPVRDNENILFTEEIFPVCSPEYLSANRAQFRRNSYLYADLIWLESAESWINWPDWLQSLSLEISDKPDRLVVNHYSMVIQAAIAGQGVALAWKGLVDPMLGQNLLIRPTDHVLKTDAGFILGITERRSVDQEADTFRRWLIEQSPKN